MDVALVGQIMDVLVQAVEAGIKYGPAVIADLRLVITLVTSGTELTDMQKAQAEAAVESAHAELQALIATDAVADNVQG